MQNAHLQCVDFYSYNSVWANREKIRRMTITCWVEVIVIRRNKV